MNKIIHPLSILFILLSSLILIALQIKPSGWIVLGCGALITLLSKDKQFRKDIILIYVSLGVIGVTPISTSIEPTHFIRMVTLLFVALILPYLISRFIYKDNLVQFTLHHGRNWYKREILYIGIIAFLAYLILPFMLRNTGSYHNWTINLETSYLIFFYFGMNLLGMWDDLFFVNTILGILRRYTPFLMANVIQAILMSTFLYQLGFRGWGFLITFGFALTQGFILKQINSLYYLITVHLVTELVLFLALVYAYYPNLVPIFLIK